MKENARGVTTRSLPSTFRKPAKQDAVQAELEKAQAETKRVQAEAVAARQKAQAETKRVQAEAEAARQKAQAETKRVQAEAEAERQKAEQLRTSMLRSSRDAKFRLRATAVIMMTAALLKMAWQAAHEPAPVIAATASRPLLHAGVAMPLHSADGSGAATALDRLREAFQSFPDEDQVAVVREVNKRYSGAGMACSLVWTDGVPVLYVGDEKGEIPVLPIASSVNQCATALEKMRAEKDAAGGRQ